MQAFSKVKINLKQIQVFHTDRGNEFKNQQIDETLKAFEIERSLNMKGYPYDNTVNDIGLLRFLHLETCFLRYRTKKARGSITILRASLYIL